jgi:hypothetical protein
MITRSAEERGHGQNSTNVRVSFANLNKCALFCIDEVQCRRVMLLDYFGGNVRRSVPYLTIKLDAIVMICAAASASNVRTYRCIFILADVVFFVLLPESFPTASCNRTCDNCIRMGGTDASVRHSFYRDMTNHAQALLQYLACFQRCGENVTVLMLAKVYSRSKSKETAKYAGILRMPELVSIVNDEILVLSKDAAEKVSV